MTYWIGEREAVDAANEDAFAAYIAANVTAETDGQAVPNPTTAWAIPAQDAAGMWVIPAYPGMDAPVGCSAATVVQWKDEGGLDDVSAEDTGSHLSV